LGVLPENEPQLKALIFGNSREALIKSPRAIGERFCSKLRFGKRRNTLCISSFSNRKVGTKDSLSADGYLFRGSLDRLIECQRAKIMATAI